MPEWSSIDPDDVIKPGMVADLDQRSAAVSEFIRTLVSLQAQFMVANEMERPDEAQHHGRQAIEMVLHSDPSLVVSALLTLAATEAAEYIESCGGAQQMVERLNAGQCQCGEDCPPKGSDTIETLEQWIRNVM
jgi:hypothetical protein